MGDTGFIGHTLQQGQHHVMQCHVRARLDGGAKGLDKTSHRGVDTGQYRVAQERRVRYRTFGLALIRLHQIDSSARAQHNVLLGIFQHETMAEVAKGIGPRGRFARQV